jgi:integrase
VEGVHRRLAHRERQGRDRVWVVNRRPSTAGSADAGTLGTALSALWETVPTGMRLTYFSRDTVPAQYRDGLGQRRGRPLGVDLSGLPEPIHKELAWCIFRIIELGGKVDVTHTRMLARWLADTVSDLGSRAPQSLAELSTRDWQQQMALSVRRRTDALPGSATAKDMRQQLTRCHRLLTAAYDTRPWWLREVWDPNLDPRIPQRVHEPRGRHSIHLDRIATGWLRGGAQWHCKVGLETGALSWGTAQLRVDTLVAFDVFLAGRDVPGPWLANEPTEVRMLMLDYLGHISARRIDRPGPRQGQPLSRARISALLCGVEQLYGFMHDNRDTAAAALSEPGWRRLGSHHAVFFRRGEKPGRQRRTREADVIDPGAFTQIMAGIGVLAEEGGLGDEQAMRILMLLARTGRRVNEICLLDRDPLLALDKPPSAIDADGLVARLHYQQTKIHGAPDTILVDQETVAIIRAQQQWADRALANRGPGTTPKYLFLAARKNRNGDRPYSSGRLRQLLTELARRLDVRDSTGSFVDFQRTHRFRHTKATSLLNAGVPLHVVQRYLGHLTPEMTMVYAHTLASTHEAEFLRYRKLTADARELTIDPRDLYDMLALDQRTDRILPNGWCLLPPRQACTKGNACLTCDKFTTDATFLPELTTQRERTLQLIDQRQAAFHARTGQDMGEDNVWLAGRHQEQHALDTIIATLQQTTPADGHGPAVRGAGTAARAAGTSHGGQERSNAR